MRKILINIILVIGFLLAFPDNKLNVPYHRALSGMANPEDKYQVIFNEDTVFVVNDFYSVVLYDTRNVQF